MNLTSKKSSGKSSFLLEKCFENKIRKKFNIKTRIYYLGERFSAPVFLLHKLEYAKKLRKIRKWYV